MRTKVFAHRGSKGTHPENTLLAFAEAVAANADGIEIDVHPSKDGHLMVIHDETVDRTTNGTGKVMTLTLAEIQALDAGSWFDAAFANLVVPTLEQVTQLLNDLAYKGTLNIEVKTDNIHYPGLEAQIHEWMLSKEWSFDFLYSSFNPQSIAILETIAPDVPKALITFDDQEMIEYGLNQLDVDAVHPQYSWIERYDDYLEKSAKSLRPWTVNQTEKIENCCDLNLAGFMTDYPRKAVKIRNEWEKHAK